MAISIIAAVGKNLELGYNNSLLCHLPKDLKRFKEITSGHTIIMGMKTWLSLPKKPLPNRRNIVVTHQNITLDGAETANSVEKALDMVQNEQETFVIGGATMYKLFLPYANKLYLTRIVYYFTADTWFPEIDEKEWQLVENEYSEKDDKNKFDLFFQTLTKKR